jgi:hypothetical protein
LRKGRTWVALHFFHKITVRNELPKRPIVKSPKKPIKQNFGVFAICPWLVELVNAGYAARKILKEKGLSNGKCKN